MMYCVVKGTTIVIDGSNNSNDVMLQNAANAGFLVSDVEILIEEEYQARKGAEPIPPQEPTEIELLKEKVSMQEMVIEELIFTIIPELTGGGM